MKNGAMDDMLLPKHFIQSLTHTYVTQKHFNSSISVLPLLMLFDSLLSSNNIYVCKLCHANSPWKDVQIQVCSRITSHLLHSNSNRNNNIYFIGYNISITFYGVGTRLAVRLNSSPGRKHHNESDIWQHYLMMTST